MASTLTPFSFGQSTIRTTTIGNAVWFVATDVAKCLGYRDAHNAAMHLDADEKGVLPIAVPLNEKGTQIVRTPGGDQKLTIINESGLYALVLRSRKPEARKFAKWVTSEVLPSIRKTGAYGDAVAKSQPAATPATGRETELSCLLAMEVIRSGRLTFEQVLDLTIASNKQFAHMVEQAVVSEKVREIKRHFFDMNIAEMNEILTFGGAMLVAEVGIQTKRFKPRGAATQINTTLNEES